LGPLYHPSQETRRVIMAVHALTSEAERSWLNRWWLPFLWITLTPVVTVPLSAVLFDTLAGYQTPAEVGLPDPARTDGCDRDGWFGGFCPTYEYSEVAPTIFAFVLPGLLNLISFLWVSSTRPRVLAAGIVAGLFGIVRVSIPVIVLMTAFNRVTAAGGTTYFDFGGGWINFSPADEVWSAGALAWLGSLLVWGLFAIVLYISEWRTGTADPGKERVLKPSRTSIENLGFHFSSTKEV
jgi:hypothetical protein